MSDPDVGVRELVYLAGRNFSFPPSVFDRSDPWLLELSQRTATGDMRTDIGLPFSGACDRPTKQPFAVGWSDLSVDDQGVAEDIVASAGSIDFCPWIVIRERFWFLEGEPFSGLLQRRDATTEVPSGDRPSDLTPYTPVLWIDGSAVTITLGAPDSAYRTPWTAPGTAGVGGSQAVVRYAPLWRVKHIKGAPKYGRLVTSVQFDLQEV